MRLSPVEWESSGFPNVCIWMKGVSGKIISGEICVERRIKLVFQGAGAHPWILERRNGLARGIYNRLKADRYYTGPQILAEVQWRLNTLVSASGYSAYQLDFGTTQWLGSWDL